MNRCDRGQNVAEIIRRSFAYVIPCGLIILVSCSEASKLAPFTSDGCSLFPDSAPILQVDWCNCCFRHDIAYWRGGTATEREAADRDLQQCVQATTGNATLARLMHEGVRTGGSPYFHSWYRWGYGWSDARKYQPLSKSELTEANRLLNEYFANDVNGVCGQK